MSYTEESNLFIKMEEIMAIENETECVKTFIDFFYSLSPEYAEWIKASRHFQEFLATHENFMNSAEFKEMVEDIYKSLGVEKAEEVPHESRVSIYNDILKMNTKEVLIPQLERFDSDLAEKVNSRQLQSVHCKGIKVDPDRTVSDDRGIHITVNSTITFKFQNSDEE